MSKMNKLAVIVSAVLMAACASKNTVYVNYHEPNNFGDYATKAGEVYPAAYSEFVSSLKIIDTQPLQSVGGIQITYRADVSDEMFETLVASFLGASSDSLKTHCGNVASLSPITIAVDGKMIDINPIKSTLYPVSDEKTRGRYDLVDFDHRLCDGLRPEWVYIDSYIGRNFPLPLYTPAMFHVYRNGRFYSEMTPGFVPGVDDQNRVNAYGLFLHRGSHEITVAYPNQDNVDSLAHVSLQTKLENATFEN